jgi:hypothetical protein
MFESIALGYALSAFKNKGEPYDHVFQTALSNEDSVKNSFKVLDLKKRRFVNQFSGFYNFHFFFTV